ncbi:MAG: hypothetical protein IPO15_22110 [Anaerolineae bacterium]|uniref:hypothetical protein n=1 Tax=Candidatus Amarolinea dominans TaxID=3140696 RepID=UPI00313730F0|nr:hypothetical protein [Anaerolineae bacterium]
MDGLANVANLQAAITSWAPSRVGPDRAYPAYMADRGSRFCSIWAAPRHQWVSPAQLNQWLTYLQALAPGVRINVIIEACQSGSFIEPLQTLSAPGRAVITSTSGRGLAWASDVGALFSDHFLDMVTLNASLGAGFRSARDAAQQIHPSQVAWLDDNGNGIPNEASDGQESALRGFAYAGTLDPDWPPLIVQASGSASLPSGQGTIRARVLDDTQGVSLVWAVIYPPSYQPPTAGSTRSLRFADCCTNGARKW